jgi:hypothetical protein
MVSVSVKYPKAVGVKVTLKVVEAWLGSRLAGCTVTLKCAPLPG